MSKTEKDKYTVRGKKKISVRLSENDLEGLEKVRMSGDFVDTSTAVRWVIHFTVAMLRIIPLAVIEGFTRTDAEMEDPLNDPVKQDMNGISGPDTKHK